MNNLRIKETFIILTGLIVIGIGCLLIYRVLFPPSKEFKTVTSQINEFSPETSSFDSSIDKKEPVQPHTIVIKNVHNTEQLGEILDILETYTIENEISDLKIKWIKEEDVDSQSTAENKEK